MPLLLTSYIFTTKVMDKIDKNYEIKKRQTIKDGNKMFTSDKFFIYSNLLNILSINDKYDVAKKLLDSLDELEGDTSEYIMKNRFDKNIILISSSLICMYSFNKSFEEYFKKYNEEDIRDLDYMFSSKNDLNPLNILNDFDKALLVEFKEYDFIKFLINKEIHFPYGEKQLENNLKTLKKALKYNFLSQPFHKKYKPFFYNKFNGKNVTLYEFEQLFSKAVDDAYHMVEKYLNSIYLK